MARITLWTVAKDEEVVKEANAENSSSKQKDSSNYGLSLFIHSRRLRKPIQLLSCLVKSTL